MLLLTMYGPRGAFGQANKPPHTNHLPSQSQNIPGGNHTNSSILPGNSTEIRFIESELHTISKDHVLIQLPQEKKSDNEKFIISNSTGDNTSVCCDFH